MRTSREDTKRQLLDAGVRLLMERGLEGGCENVGMADVVADIEQRTGRRITNASIYGRIWATQSEFHRELLVQAAEQFPDGEERSMRAAADRVLVSADLATPNGRQAALVAVCREAGVAHLAALSASRSWQTWLAIWAITVSTPTLEDDIERGPAIAHRHALAVAAIGGVLDDIVTRVGRVLRLGLSVEQFANAVYALSEGLVLHDRFAPDSGPVVMAEEEWSLFSVALLGLFNQFTEPQ